MLITRISRGLLISILTAAAGQPVGSQTAPPSAVNLKEVAAVCSGLQTAELEGGRGRVTSGGYDLEVTADKRLRITQSGRLISQIQNFTAQDYNKCLTELVRLLAPPHQNYNTTMSDPGSLVRPRMFLGTLPPRGVSSLSYAIANGSTGSITDATVSAWAIDERTLKKVDERSISYIAAGDGRVFEELSSPIHYGKGILCISYKYSGKRVAVLHFFQSTGEYIRYGPVREMQQFRDPVIDTTSGTTCELMPRSALAYING